MTINNFNPNVSQQQGPLDSHSARDQPVDFRINGIQAEPLDLRMEPIQEQPLDLRINRIQAQALYYANEGEAMDLSEPLDLRPMAPRVSRQESSQIHNCEASAHCLSASFKKKIIECATINGKGDITALNFSKMSLGKLAIRDQIFAHLDTTFDKPNIYETVNKIILKNNKLFQLPENISEFRNLRSIDLSNNRFTSIPFQIYNFKKLKKLVINNNNINYISIQIGKLKNLEELHLKANNLTHIHMKLYSLKKLHTLDLSENELSEISRCIHKLQSLETLKISDNNLFSIPKEIFGKNLEYLDLSDNHIDVIPDAIKNSQELRDINFDNNEIVNIPDEIGNLKHLTAVSFNNNSTLRGFSENLYLLPAGCTVEIEHSGLSLAILSEIKNISSAEGYNGPAFEFSIEFAEERLEERLVEALYVHCHQRRVPRFSNLRALSDQLEMWLNRLDWMSDFQYMARNPSLPKSIIDCIEYAESNEEYRKLFKEIIEGATATCGDGVALSVIDLDIAKQVLRFTESNQIKELSHFLLHTAFPRQILQKLAGQKITFLKLQKNKGNNFLVDDVEVYLTYALALKHRLNLSITVDSMVMEIDKTGVTNEDLEVAASEVEKQKASSIACAEFLIQNTYWIELLKKLYPKAYEEINEQSVEMMEESIEAAEEYRGRSLIALSGITL